MLRQAEASKRFVVGFVSYEAAPAFDDALKAGSSGEFPLLCLGLFPAPEILENLETVAGEYHVGPFEPSVSREDFIQSIDRIKDQIAAGATYQVNYTYRLNATFNGDPWVFFCSLTDGQRAEYSSYIEFDDFAICSASPELFFQRTGSRIIARPMKGTAPRGRTFSEDWQQADALRGSEKDRAENIMIVDMIRNDIGRIAEPGSVETVSTFDVEKYPTVWQMTSSVQGRVGASCQDVRGPFSERSLTDIFGALFPCASITGAPKAKTMEIIRDLETSPRKIYTGTIGFMTPSGEACFNVAIRTALIDRAAGTMEYGVGGGIVWDSDATAEYEETLTKAKVLTQPRPGFRLLETMLWQPGEGIFLLSEHLQRLGKSAAYFDVPVDMYAIHAELERVTAGLEKEHLNEAGGPSVVRIAAGPAALPHRIRLLVNRDGTFEVQCYPLGQSRVRPPSALPSAIPVLRLDFAKEPVDLQDVFLFHKTTHRTVYERAKADAPDCDDVILWNERGEVTESTIANVVIRRDGRLVTPPVDCGLLAGTFRDHLLKAGEIEEGVITPDDLRAADAIYLINSVRMWQKAELAG